MMTKKTVATPGYSRSFLEQYGRSLPRAEIRLIQGYRGLGRWQRADLLEPLSRLTIALAVPDQRAQLADDLRTRRWQREAGTRTPRPR